MNLKITYTVTNEALAVYRVDAANDNDDATDDAVQQTLTKGLSSVKFKYDYRLDGVIVVLSI